MVLETLDIKQEDIFIYSENRFDLQNNFRLIYKDQTHKIPLNIHYNDVCNYLTDGKPKNLLAYRLLTNLNDIDFDYMKYGFPLKIGDNKELIYFDPVFALMEIEDYGTIKDDPSLRFRIQQVGLVSHLSSPGNPSFIEVYSFDLEAHEVEHQNDRVYAEIIFAFDDIDFESYGEYDAPSGPVKKITAVGNDAVKQNKDDKKRKTDSMFEEDEHGDASRANKIVVLSDSVSDATRKALSDEQKRKRLQAVTKDENTLIREEERKGRRLTKRMTAMLPGDAEKKERYTDEKGNVNKSEKQKYPLNEDRKADEQPAKSERQPALFREFINAVKEGAPSVKNEKDVTEEKSDFIDERRRKKVLLRFKKKP